MAYNVSLTRAATKELDALPATMHARVAEAIRGLQNEPRPRGCLKLKGESVWRIRVGDYRVFYAIRDDEAQVLVLEIGHRKDAYR